MPFEKLQLFCSWRISWNHSILWNLLSYDSFFSLFWKKFVKSKQEEVYSHAPHLVLHNFSHFLRNIACKKFAKTVKKNPLICPKFDLKSWPILHSSNLIWGWNWKAIITMLIEILTPIVTTYMYVHTMDCNLFFRENNFSFRIIHVLQLLLRENNWSTEKKFREIGEIDLLKK